MNYIQHLRLMVAGAFVFDQDNRMLTQKRSDNGSDRL